MSISRLFGLLLLVWPVAPVWADDALPAEASPAEASPVGRIITPRGPVCTGVLVGEQAVLTAAHCLVTRAGDGYFSAPLIHFALYPAPGQQLYAKAVEHHVSPAYRLPVGTDPDQLRADWAVVWLDEPLGRQIAPAPVVTAATPGNPEAFALEVVAFGRARTLRPTINASACRLLGTDPGLLHHSCMVEPGSSGSVLLGRRDGQVHALAVNVAIRRGTGARTTAALLPPTIAALAARIPNTPDQWESPFSRTGEASWAQ